MNTVMIKFNLRYVPKGAPIPRRGFEGVTSSFALFKELSFLLGLTHLVERANENEMADATFTAASGTPESEKALAMLKSAGLMPAFTRYVMKQKVTECIPIRRDSSLTPQRLDACCYLRLAFSEARVGYHYTTEGDTLVAMAEKDEFKKTADIGDLAPSRRMAVSSKFIESFQAAGLKGAAFLPIQWRSYPGRTDVPDKPIRTHWLNAEKEMPRCLTPRVGFSSDLTGVHFWDNEELIKHAVPDMECGWDDEGRTDFTLRFCRKDVEALGEFDIASTYEWIHLVGNENPRWFPQLIVSQRFRQWAKKQKYKLHYGLCDLID